MLRGIVTSPSTSITRLPCISVADTGLLQKFNAPSGIDLSLHLFYTLSRLTLMLLALPVEPTVSSLHELFHLQAKKTPLATAFIEHRGRTFTYHEWGILTFPSLSFFVLFSSRPDFIPLIRLYIFTAHVSLCNFVAQE